jgi:KDO2-lipid IV(A) lauroyltransferase
VVSENLKRSFPAKSDPELNILRRKFYRHFCDLLAEGIKNLRRGRKKNKSKQDPLP